MKKSCMHIICALIAAVVLGAVAVTMAYFGVLPGLYEVAWFALMITLSLILVLFLVASFSACRCSKKLAIALCRYGTAFVAALIMALLFGMALLIIPPIGGIMALFLVVLFFATFSFVLAILLLAFILYTLATLGCPHCPKPQPPCGCNSEDNFTL